MTNSHTVPGLAAPAVRDEHGSVPGHPGPGVPLSIWPGAPAGSQGRHDPAHCGFPVTAWAAAQVIAAFSRPGDLVAVPDGSAAVIEAAAAAGRRVLGLIPGTAHGGPALAALRSRLDPAARPYARLRPGGPDLLLAPGNPDTGQAALAVTGCHAPSSCPAPEPGSLQAPGLLYAACERVLAPGGILAVITASPAADGQLTDLAGHAVASARAAGLVYAQHIVLVHAAINGDKFAPDPVPAPAPAGPASLAGGSRIHSDLLVFTKPGGTPRHD